MAKWVRFQLNKGKIGDEQLISEPGFAMMHTPFTTIGSNQQYDEVSLGGYALGWGVNYYRGHKRVTHGGGIDGFTAHVGLLPRDNIGLTILTNRGGTPLPTIVSYYIMDLLLDNEPVDWHARLKTQVDAAEANAKKREKEREEQRVAKTKTSRKPEEFVGEYEHPAYGVFTISHSDNTLRAQFNSADSPLEHWHYDVFQISDGILENIKITFSGNEKGDLAHLSIPIEPSVDAIIFKRKPSSKLTDPEFLSKLTGEYDLNGTTITVAKKDENAITVTVPGQPTYDLEPYKETTFNLKGLTGFSLKFDLDKKGAAKEATFLQPNGTFRAIRK